MNNNRVELVALCLVQVLDLDMYHLPKNDLYNHSRSPSKAGNISTRLITVKSTNVLEGKAMLTGVLIFIRWDRLTSNSKRFNDKMRFCGKDPSIVN